MESLFKKSKKEKVDIEYDKMMREAHEMPGVAELMELYEEFNKQYTKSREYLGIGRRRKIIYSATDSSF